jgi:hypothetical protein
MDRTKNDRINPCWDMLALASAVTRDWVTDIAVFATVQPNRDRLTAKRLRHIREKDIRETRPKPFREDSELKMVRADHHCGQPPHVRPELVADRSDHLS